jgi:hypothetical protein
VPLTDAALLATVQAGALTFDDTSGLENYTTYYYAVASVNPVGLNAAAAVSEMPGLLPNAPSSLAAATGAAPVALSWAAPAPGGLVEGYVVYRSPAPDVDASDDLVLTTASTSGSDSSAQNYQGYYYRVAATNPKGHGPTSNEIYVYPKDFTVPVESDPPPTITGGDQTGRSVAISRNYALVGAPRLDNGQADTGAVYVYQRQGDSTWLQGPTLAKSPTSGDPAAAEQFGYSVALAGDVAMVGAPLANWPVPTPFSTANSGNGRVYVFRRQADNSWLHEKNLQSDSTSVPDQFGIAVAADGTTAIVGARQDQAADSSDNCGTIRGAVYFFDISQGSGSTQLARFEPVKAVCSTFPLNLSNYGQSVAISGDFAIVGAPQEKNNIPNETGAAYFYRRVDGTWQHLSSDKKLPSRNYTAFGFSVAIRGTLAAVGAPQEICLAPDVACPGAGSNGISGAGAVHLYRWTGSAWTDLATFRAPVASQNGNFGQSLALEADTIVVGAGPISATTAAARTVYRCTGSGASWSCQTDPVIQETNNLPLSGISPAPVDTGFSVAIEGDNLVVGRPSADRDGQAGTDDAGSVEFY